MPGEFKLEIELNNTRYVLNRMSSDELLELLCRAVGGGSEMIARIRRDLGAALEKKEDGPTRDSRRATLDADADGEKSVEDGAARCAWCGEAGEELPMRPGDTEPLYVCRTKGCGRNGLPAARDYFTTGYR